MMRLVPVLLGALLAQDPAPRATFTSRTDLAVLHVSVLDREAGFVGGLPRESFLVRENGRPQPITLFEHDDTPVTVGLVIDNSGSMGPRRDTLIAAGMAFAASCNPADELFTVHFNERVWPGLPAGQPFTHDHNELHTALKRSTARGKTALFDALTAAMHHLEQGTQPRKALVVFGDGGDNASRTTFDAVLDMALRRDVVIYTIGLTDPDNRESNPKILRELAAVTGGEAFFPRTNDEIPPALERIARDLRSSYTIGYVPPPESDRNSRREIRVHVNSPDRRPLKVRARSVYISGGGGDGR